MNFNSSFIDNYNFRVNTLKNINKFNYYDINISKLNDYYSRNKMNINNIKQNKSCINIYNNLSIQKFKNEVNKINKVSIINLINIIFEKMFSNIKTIIEVNPHETITNLIKLYILKSRDNINDVDFFFNNKQVNTYIGKRLTLIEAGLNNKDKIIVKSNNCLIGAGQLNTNINIKFLKLYQAQQSKIFINSNLNKILKLCLLKEISSKLRNEELNNLPKNVSDIMIVLKNGYIGNNNNKDLFVIY
jgi:hypothetical protein